MALTQDYARKQLAAPQYVRRVFPVAASTVIYKGSMVALDTAGNLVPASATAANFTVGMALDGAESAATAGANSVLVDMRPSSYRNSAAADEITADDIGALCYVVDDDTVALTDDTGNRPVAGTIWQMDGTRVYVLPPLTRA